MSGLDQLGALRQQLKHEAERRADAEKKQKAQAEQAQYESKLFHEAVGVVQPVRAVPKAKLTTTAPAPVAAPRLPSEERASVTPLSDEFEPGLLLEDGAPVSWQRPPLASDITRQLRRGHWPVQDQLDLHGARTNEARLLVSDFLTDCSKYGVRCVRIVHGKGHGSPDREPVLKGKVPQWLRQCEQVLAFCEAKPAAGGSGALIVLLKGRR
jgi:DNA-nicking Smr family endonuclease